jgi:hypothetical protein
VEESHGAVEVLLSRRVARNREVDVPELFGLLVRP